MESGSRKRKRCHVYEKEEEEEEKENEEEKIERFFKLIKSIREARERLELKESGDHALIEDSYSSEIDKMRKKNLAAVKDEKQKAAVWKPCFQLEDFMEDHEAHHFINTSLLPLVSAPPSHHELQRPSKDKMEGLDLNLSL